MATKLLNSEHKAGLCILMSVLFLWVAQPMAVAQERIAPQPGQLLVSEVLFNPLDDGADYVELYNAGEAPLSLHDVVLVKVKGDGSMGRFYPLCDSCLLPSQRWFVATTDRAWVLRNYQVATPSLLIEVPSLPSLANDEGTVLVALKDSTVIDRFDYSEKMHNPLLRNREGVALERQSYSCPTQDEANWSSASSLCGYGTPTAANSQSTEHLFIYDDFVAESPTFTPDGDGIDDEFVVHYTLSDPTLLCNVMVFDPQGRDICYPVRGHLLGAEGTLRWNGYGNGATLCAQGNYVLFISVYNKQGQQQRHKMVATLLR